LGTRHRIIAEKIVERQLKTSSAIVNVLQGVLRKLNPANEAEVYVCRSLLINYIGTNGMERRFSEDQIRQLFKTATEEGKLEDSAVLHHFGLFESDKGNQEQALELINRALKLIEKKQQLFFLRNERPENIYCTLGTIYSKRGQEAEQKGDSHTAELSYSAATDSFAHAKGGELQTPHPYDSECRMFCYRAERTQDTKTKIEYYLEALNVIDEAEENLAEENLPRLLELKARIQAGLADIKDLQQTILKMQQERSTETQAALAEGKLALLSKEASNETLQRAFEIVKKVAATPMANACQKPPSLIHP
jgi:hypothetical protein